MLCQREEREAGRAYPRTCPTCKLGPCQKFGAKPLQSLADAQAEIARLTAALEESQAAEEGALMILAHTIAERDTARAEIERWRHMSIDNWSAFSAMRNHINEHLPMRSAEADLQKGPEFSVSCENVSEDVIAALAARDKAIREQTMREAAEYHEARATDEDALSQKYRGGSNPWFAHVQAAKSHRENATAILALIDKEQYHD